ncbi:MAG TPA: menaquinone biosynthesis protein [Oculatellaceae cyanobacterium]|jgi:chorismate dehydratase
MTNRTNVSTPTEMKPGTVPSDSVRVGAIAFINTIPIYTAYTPLPDSSLHYEVPAVLNAKIRAGELEISPVSSACYLREKHRLVLLNDLSVSSYGAVESVIFLSKIPLGPDLLEYPCINIPDDSETSVALLAYLLKEKTGQNFQANFSVYHAANYRNVLQERGNALVIGDNALLLQNAIAQGEIQGFHCYDLSTLWKEKTGLPFVFSVWVANRDWAYKEPEKLDAVNYALCKARDCFYQDSRVFAEGIQRAQNRSGLPEETLERYYRHCLDYRLDEAHRQSLALFDTILCDLD